jgi:aminopeptidase N
MRIFMLLVLLVSACRHLDAETATAVPVNPGHKANEQVRPPTLRLGNAISPQRYRLDLTVLPEQQSLKGKVSIDAVNTAESPAVWLNASELKIVKATVNGQPATVIETPEDFVGLQVKTSIAKGPLTIDIDYEAKVDFERSRGVYSEKEGEERYAYTFFEPIDARRAFPCFDEPGFKVPMGLTLHVKREHVALANSPVASEHQEPDGMKRVVFEDTPPLPTYLLAFVVGPFEVVDGGTASGVPIRFVIPQGRAPELTWAKEITPRVVTALVDYFQMGFPFKKLDVAVVPRFWGTMEHPGLVAMGQPLTLIRPEEMTRQRKQAYANILTHELAHYWFGDLVTMAWWDDTWLNEALGAWTDLFITDSVMPEWKFVDTRVRAAASAMDVDEMASTQPIRVPVSTRQAIESAFDGQITYAKGASVARMFEASVGKPKWQAFIQKYLRKHQRGNTTARDFLSAMSEELGPLTAKGFASFLERPGVPLVTATAECSPTKPAQVRFNQRRALAFGVQKPSTETAWTFPVCFRYGDGTKNGQQCVLLSEEAEKPAIAVLDDVSCPKWLLLNGDARGYYRSSVDPKMVRELLNDRSTIGRQAAASVAEQWMLMVDFAAAATRGDVPVDEALKTIPLVVRSRDDRLARAASQLLTFEEDALDESLHQQSQKYRRQVFAPVAQRLGWKRGAGDSDDRQQLRQTMLWLSVSAGETRLTQEGNKLLKAWLKDPSSSGLDGDLVDLALAAAGQVGDAAVYEDILKAIVKAPDRQMQARLTRALGHFTAPMLVTKSLGRIAENKLDVREGVPLLQTLLAHRESRPQTWEWVRGNLNWLVPKMRSDDAARFLGGLAPLFCDEARIAEAQILVNPYLATTDGAQAEVERGLEAARLCVARQRRDVPALQRFFAAQK